EGAAFERGGLLVIEDQRIAVRAIHARDGGVGEEAAEIGVAVLEARRLGVAEEFLGGLHRLRKIRRLEFRGAGFVGRGARRGLCGVEAVRSGASALWPAPG